MHMYVVGCSLPIIACIAALNQKRNLSNDIHVYMYQLFDVRNFFYTRCNSFGAMLEDEDKKPRKYKTDILVFNLFDVEKCWWSTGNSFDN